MSTALSHKNFASPLNRPDFEVFVKELLNNAIEEKVFPGCIFGVVHPELGEILLPFGNFEFKSTSSQVGLDTLYDVASVTKLVPTSMLLLRLINERRLSVDDFVQKHLPFFKGKGAENVTIRHLLSFAYDREINQNLALINNKDELHHILFDSDLRDSIGKFSYRNTTSYIQKKLIEHLYGMSYREAAEEFIFQPLNINPTFSPDGNLCAPTEFCSIRQRMLVGEVHDEFSWNLKRLTGEDSGASGLFMNGKDSLKLLSFLAGESTESIFPNNSKDFVSYMMTNQLGTTDLSARYGLGVDLLHKGYGPCECCEQRTMAITGFTGCSFVAQPKKRQGFFLISNSIHPVRKTRIGKKSPLYDLRKKIFYEMQCCKHCFS